MNRCQLTTEAYAKKGNPRDIRSMDYCVSIIFFSLEVTSCTVITDKINRNFRRKTAKDIVSCKVSDAIHNCICALRLVKVSDLQRGHSVLDESRLAHIYGLYLYLNSLKKALTL